MHIEPTITFEQYKAALEAMRKPAERRFGKTKWLTVAFIVIFSFSLVIEIKAPSTRDSSLAGFIILTLLLSALWVWAKFKTQSCLKHAYKAQETQLNGQQMEINEDGIVGQLADGRMSYQYKWSAFERFIDLPDSFLFLPNSVSFVRIPKESLSFDDLQMIEKWSAKIEPQAPS